MSRRFATTSRESCEKQLLIDDNSERLRQIAASDVSSQRRKSFLVPSRNFVIVVAADKYSRDLPKFNELQNDFRPKNSARDGKVWEKLSQAHGECVEKYGRK